MRHRNRLTITVLAGAFAVAASPTPAAQMPPDLLRRSGASTAGGEGEERSHREGEDDPAGELPRQPIREYELLEREPEAT